jgi:hypothetical protein
MADKPPLVASDDLLGFDGAPFSVAVTSAASQMVRRVCGWHIAPSVTETIVLDHDGSGVVHLQSLFVTDVATVRDLSGSTPRDLTLWRWSADGMLEGNFPEGFRVLEVTFTHGYEACPEELLPVIASRAVRRVMQESLGARSVTYSADLSAESVLDTYRLGPRP